MHYKKKISIHQNDFNRLCLKCRTKFDSLIINFFFLIFSYKNEKAIQFRINIYTEKN